ncbi:MAG TPA: aminotransferase class I/II-fold pyridoxal phosphate-dependent enzyme [Candidatus Syntrophoarchaeum butanivorans]|uniref:Aminotransferase n=1 Tax=Candidatus Syntropharchaeum butanivorans TaxID=1839936 RepID=A0A7C1AW67_9EURY|nr:MAG: aminotransferase class I/II-fold pyridoxal phosphate-dependent enzyme [Candidatus Syntrophoarchaeum sp. WYZ-LMO15]HDM36868.1 aminotransferase class I/II-fold pyridoxal phosphate-dependent enzyme [Candidatus Syntrophoarchaeum butanivorans]
MKPISKRMEAIPASGIRKFFDLILSTPDVISLGVGEPDFVTPWHIREAGISALEHGHTSYTSNWGLIELRELISASLRCDCGVDYDPHGQILVTSGVSEALDIALRVLVDPGDEVIVIEPSYVSYKPCVRFAEGVSVVVPTKSSNEFKPVVDDIRERITDKTKVLILSYPNNPTGAVLTRKELEDIADLVNEYDLYVISDEIYSKLTYNGEHTCFSSLNGMKERTILLNGFSKAYAMTGWRIGYAAGSREVIEAMMKVHQYTMLCAPIQSQLAACEALRNGDKSCREMVEEYNRRRRLMVAGLEEAGLECFNPRGAFYAFPSIKSSGLSSTEFAERLLEEKKVAVVPGNVFGACGEGFVRCSYAVSIKDLVEALERIKEFMEELDG